MPSLNELIKQLESKESRIRRYRFKAQNLQEKKDYAQEYYTQQIDEARNKYEKEVALWLQKSQASREANTRKLNTLEIEIRALETSCERIKKSIEEKNKK